MLGRFLVCAIACGIALGAALPASAGERIVYSPVPDTMSLLMQDDRATFVAVPALPLLMMDKSATFATEPVPVAPQMLRLPQMRGYAMRDAGLIEITASPARADLSGFDALSVASIADRPAGWVSFADAPMALSAEAVAHPSWRAPSYVRNTAEVTASNGGGYAVSEGTSWITRRRPPRALDATLVFRIDGQRESPVFSVGGGVAATIWQAIPKN